MLAELTLASMPSFANSFLSILKIETFNCGVHNSEERCWSIVLTCIKKSLHE
jgi:hypothetical protein